MKSRTSSLLKSHNSVVYLASLLKYNDDFYAIFQIFKKISSVTEAPARYRAWTSHYPGERATDYTTGTSRGHQRVSPEGEPCASPLSSLPPSFRPLPDRGVNRSSLRKLKGFRMRGHGTTIKLLPAIKPSFLSSASSHGV